MALIANSPQVRLLVTHSVACLYEAYVDSSEWGNTVTRFRWPVPSDGYFRRRVTEGEGATVQYRIERNRFLWEEFGPPADMLLIGGIPAMFALDELMRSYVYGNFMATVLLAQAFVEQSLGGSYSLAGKDHIVKKGFAGLIDAARDDAQITPEVADALHHLRRMRNPYTHHTIGKGKRSYMGRIAESAFMLPEDLVVEDAKFAVRTVVDFLRQGQPDWNPENVKWSEEDI